MVLLLQAYQILTIIAGVCTSLTVIGVGIGKICKFIIDRYNRKQLTDSIPETQQINKDQQQAITEIQHTIQKITGTLNEMHSDFNKRFDEISKQMNSQNDLLINDARYVLESTMRKSIIKGWACVEEKMNMGDLFAAYSAAGGNHGIGDLYSVYKHLPPNPPSI